MKKHILQRFRVSQPDSNENPLISMDFLAELQSRNAPYFRKDMRKLTSKVLFSTTEDSEFVKLMATESNDSIKRGYEISPESNKANISILSRSPLKISYSDRYRTQFELGKVNYTIKHEGV